MALHFPLMVNGEQIGSFVARRREAVIPADRVCTYDVEVELNGVRCTAVVRHNYDAGAYALILAALTAVPALTNDGRGGGDVMPVFPIKAKDKLAVLGVNAYRGLCLEAGLTEQAAQVDLAIGELMRWRADHPDEMKFPDHRHVPAGLANLLPVGQHCASCDGHSCPDVG